MRGGHNKKTIQDHLNNGTYRPSLHGYILPTDEEALKNMKSELYNEFIMVTKEIKNIDKNSEKYKQLNDVMISQIKAFHSIAKTPIVEDKENKTENKDGFKTL